MKLKTKLLLNSVFILGLLGGLGFLSIYHLEALYNKSWQTGVRDAPLGDAAMEIKLTLTRGHLWLEEILAESIEKKSIEKVWASFEESRWYCEAILKGGSNAEGIFYPADDPIIEAKARVLQEKIQRFITISKQRWADFQQHGSKNLHDLTDAQHVEKDHDLDLIFDDIFTETINVADEVEELLHDKIRLETKDMVDHIRESKFIQTILGLLIVFFIAWSLFMVWHSLTRGLSAAGKMVSQLAEGNLQARAEVDVHDEMGLMLQAMNKMTDKHQQMINNIQLAFNDIAQGQLKTRISDDFTGDFTVIKDAANNMTSDLQAVVNNTNRALAQLANGETILSFDNTFSGDFAQIRTALESAGEKLGKATEKNMTQDWLKTGQSHLGEQIRGDKPLQNLMEDIINFIAPYLDAQVGAFYLLQTDDKTEKNTLNMMASHAYIWRKSAQHSFAIGEGLIGQAALEHKMFVIEEPPTDYVHIQSGLGDAPPRMILVAPFLYETELKGVLELASLRAFSPIHLEFLKQALPTIAIAINTAESRQRMKRLWEQSEAQAHTLRIQQAEMTKQQVALQESNEKLTAQTEELQSQSEELQAQAEELRVQQEELRQTNDTLAQRTRDLERQQIDVEQKNLDLEKAKTAIQAKANELEVSSKYKSEFLANMSHELRTPLNSLLILAQMLAKNKQGHLDEKEVEQAATIHSAGTDLLSLINDILDLSKVEAGKLALCCENFALQAFLDKSRQRFQALADRKNIDFQLSIAEGMPSNLSHDIQRLRQIISNLLSNAFKFTEKGAIKLHVYHPNKDELLGLNLDANHSIAFSVTDSGIGIPANKQQVIFEAFQQADGTTSRRFGGTGLGLSISRQLARLLGGDIRLHSQENHGSTFTLYVPETLAEEKCTTDTVQPAKNITVAATTTNPITIAPVALLKDDREQLIAGQKTILIIEDDPQFIKILQQAGHDEGYQCLIAQNGRDGLAMAKQYLPNAIILDIGLPLLDGLTVMDTLKQDLATRHIPIHVISGGEYGHKVKQMGALGYYLKPVKMVQLSELFLKFRHVLNHEIRRILLISNNMPHRATIQHLLENKDVQIDYANTATDALAQLQNQRFDCAVLDMDADATLASLQLLHENYAEVGVQVPLIIYAERELSEAEEGYLRKWHGDFVLKTVGSPERLIDEVALFLHQTAADLPEEKRKMLHLIHDKETILTGRKVLLVDDDMRNVYALTTVLENKKMQVFVAENGKQALEVLANEAHIDVVLMDIMMPEMDGYITMRHIREQKRFRKLPILALTAKAMKDDRNKCLEAGANDYMSKPIDGNQLLSLLRLWLYP